MNVAKLATWLIWGDTKGWIDPSFRQFNKTAEDKMIEEGMRKEHNRQVNLLLSNLGKMKNQDDEDFIEKETSPLDSEIVADAMDEDKNK